MQLPNITLMEIVIVAAAFVLLCIAPAVLTWSDERRRRSASAVPLPAIVTETALPLAVGLQADSDVSTADTVYGDVLAAAAFVNPPLGDEADPTAVDRLESPTVAPVVEESPGAVFQAVEGAAPHQFRLEELRRARLADWPPAAVRGDAERSRLWQEGERLAAQHERMIASLLLASPYPAQSSCVGTVNADGARYFLHYLLFPTLWPVEANQAVAEVIFEIDPASGDVHHRMQALSPTDLTDEQRRDIRQSGGHI